MRKVHDLGLLPEYERECRAKDRTLFEIAREPSLNPLDRLLDAADLANRRESGSLSDLAKLLKSEDAAVRWWGAVGIAALGDKASSAVEVLRDALTDSSPEVRIAAAEGLEKLGHDDEALPVLLAGLEHPSPVVRLRALNVLDRLGVKTPVVLKAIRAGRTVEPGPVAEYVNRMVEYVPDKLEQDQGKADSAGTRRQ